MLRKIVLLCVFGALGVSVLKKMTGALNESRQKNVLVICNWSEFIPAEILEDFEKETGIHVVYDPLDIPEVLEVRLANGRSGYDVVFLQAIPYMARLLPFDCFEPLDKTQIPNLKNLEEKVLKMVEKADPGMRYAVPYLYDALGIVYNETALERAGLMDLPLDSWASVFEPENAKRLEKVRLSFMDEPMGTFQCAAIFYGLHPANNNSEDLKAVFKRLQSVRSSVFRFDPHPVSALLNGDIGVAVTYLSIGQHARRLNPKIRCILPKEGSIFSIDTMVVPKNPGPRDEMRYKNALRLINFILEPKNIAKITAFVRSYNPIQESWDLLAEDVRNDPNIFFKPEVPLFEDRLPTVAYELLRNELWTCYRSNMFPKSLKEPS